MLNNVPGTLVKHTLLSIPKIEIKHKVNIDKDNFLQF
jgi:hypothetical protein